MHLFHCKRPCSPACKPNACVCKLKTPPKTSNIAGESILTPCEEKENNGFAGFYSDESDGKKICDTIYFKATRPNPIFFLHSCVFPNFSNTFVSNLGRIKKRSIDPDCKDALDPKKQELELECHVKGNYKIW